MNKTDRKKQKIISMFLLCIILFPCIFLCGCEEEQKEQPGEPVEQEEAATIPKATTLNFTPETYPRVDGSTATIPLSESFAASLMGIPLEEARQLILHNTTHNAYVNLIEGNADLIFVTSPSIDELALAREKGIELEVIPVVSEGFVFLVSEDNPVDALTLEDVVGIYSGQITNWSEVRGDNVKIRAYQRPTNSGSQTGMLDLVMKGVPMIDPPTEQVTALMGELIDAVATYDNEPDAIGYSYYYYVTDMWGQKATKLLKIDGVYPDEETIRSGRYPLNTAYYAVIRGNEPEGSDVRKTIEWILSEEGQTVAEEAGYVRVGDN